MAEMAPFTEVLQLMGLSSISVLERNPLLSLHLSICPNTFGDCMSAVPDEACLDHNYKRGTESVMLMPGVLFKHQSKQNANEGYVERRQRARVR